VGCLWHLESLNTAVQSPDGSLGATVIESTMPVMIEDPARITGKQCLS
jgi:hypothetical protein